jgi:hypothetical protein
VAPGESWIEDLLDGPWTLEMVTEPAGSCSGPVEGHVNRIKMLKRQMHGRAKVDLLRKRVLWSPAHRIKENVGRSRFSWPPAALRVVLGDHGGLRHRVTLLPPPVASSRLSGLNPAARTPP